MQEKSHREFLLLDERSRKNKSLLKWFLLAIFLLLVASIWYYISGALDVTSILLGIAGVAMGFQTLQSSDIPTLFEQRQLVTLSEIHNLLRERG